MFSICTGTEESSQRSWCCPIDILSNNPSILAFGRQELDCYVTRVECGLRFWAVMLASWMWCSTTPPQTAPVFSLLPPVLLLPLQLVQSSLYLRFCLISPNVLHRFFLHTYAACIVLHTATLCEIWVCPCGRPFFGASFAKTGVSSSYILF